MGDEEGPFVSGNFAQGPRFMGPAPAQDAINIDDDEDDDDFLPGSGLIDKIGDRPDKVGPEPKPGMKKRGKKGKKEEDDFSSGSGQIATFMDKIENIMSGRDNEGMKKRQKKGILEDVITGGAAADFMEPSGLSEGKIKRKEEGGKRKEEGGKRKEKGGKRKEKGGKRKEEEDYFSGSILEEPVGTDPAGIFDEMPAEVVAAVAEEMKPNDVTGIVEGMDKVAAANMFEEMVSRRMAERRGEKTKKDKKEKKKEEKEKKKEERKEKKKKKRRR